MLQMAGDAAVGGVFGGYGAGADIAMREAASLGAMGARTFGQGASEAEQAGANLGQQLGYGATVAGIEVITEKIFDGVAGIYGAGEADDITEMIVRSSPQPRQDRTLSASSSR